jgi:hypothetical protein
MGRWPTEADENGGEFGIGWQARGMAEVVAALELLSP